jgi:hypothetical protein
VCVTLGDDLGSSNDITPLIKLFSPSLVSCVIDPTIDPLLWLSRSLLQDYIFELFESIFAIRYVAVFKSSVGSSCL